MIASCLRVRDFHLEPHQAATGICDIDQLVQNFIDAEVGSAWFFSQGTAGPGKYFKTPFACDSKQGKWMVHATWMVHRVLLSKGL